MRCLWNMHSIFLMEEIQPRNKNVVINPLTPSGRSQQPVVQTKMVSFIKCYHWISRITEHTALALQSSSSLVGFFDRGQGTSEIYRKCLLMMSMITIITKDFDVGFLWRLLCSLKVKLYLKKIKKISNFLLFGFPFWIDYNETSN